MDITALRHPCDWPGKTGHRLTPTTPEQVAELLAHYANQDLVQPMALSYQDAFWMESPLWLDLGEMKAIKAHWAEDFMIEVQTGITLGELAQALQKHRQNFPLQAPPETRLSDLLAEDRPTLETGCLGYPRDYVLKSQLATPDGELSISGANVLKNATGYDLSKLHVGAHHALGVLTTVTLKLSVQQPERYWGWFFTELGDAFSLMETLQNQHLPLTACELYATSRLPLRTPKNGWELLIRLSAEENMQQEFQALLQQFSQPKRVIPAQADTLTHTLNHWPPDRWVVELALPKSQVKPCLEALSNTPATKTLQARPAAGLIYALFPPEDVHGNLETIQQLAQNHGGFMHIVQCPTPDLALMRQYNIPTDPTIGALLNALKTQHDPQNLLFSPRLPL